MNNFKSISLMAAIIIIAMIIVSTAFCDELKNDDFIFGAKIGTIGNGSLDVDDINIKTKSSYCFGVFGDKPLIDGLYGGVAVDFFEIKTESDQEYLMNGSLIIKRELKTASKKFLFQPAFGVGYGIMEELLFLKPLDFVSIQCFGDIVYVTEKKIGVLLSIGAIWLPYAGDNEYDISSGARLILRAGVRF